MIVNSISRGLLLVAAVVLGQPSSWAANISFTHPAANHNYAPDTPISYGGSGGYNVGESKTTDVEVELMWFPTDSSLLSAGVVTDYDDAIITYDKSGGSGLAYLLIREQQRFKRKVKSNCETTHKSEFDDTRVRILLLNRHAVQEARPVLQ